MENGIMLLAAGIVLAGWGIINPGGDFILCAIGGACIGTGIAKIRFD